MRDDIFILWDQDEKEFDCFYWYLNGMSIKRENDRLVTKVYRKPTHTQKYIHWSSNQPKNLLLGVLKVLIHRAHQLCDLKDDLLEELDLLRDVSLLMDTLHK